MPQVVRYSTHAFPYLQAHFTDRGRRLAWLMSGGRMIRGKSVGGYRVDVLIENRGQEQQTQEGW